MDISCAVDLRTALGQALEMGQEIRVSFGETAELDVTAVQLLWAASRDARQRKLGFTISEWPDTVRRALQGSGIDLDAVFLSAAGG